MNPREYIRNGTVADYCLGLLQEEARLEFEIALELYPDLKEELHRMQNSLKGYMSAKGKVVPAPDLKKKIWNTLQNLNLEKNLDLANLPLINKYTDTQKWMDAVSPLLPAQIIDGRFMRVLTQTDTVTQVLVVTTTDVEEEIHDDLRESFIILSGECECRIGEDVVVVKAGGFLEIPLHVHHNVRVLSDRIVGVMQRVAV